MRGWIWGTGELTLMVRMGGATIRLINPAATQTQNQGFELAHPKIHPICDLLGHTKELVLQIQNCRISMTQANSRIPKGVPVSPVPRV